MQDIFQSILKGTIVLNKQNILLTLQEIKTELQQQYGVETLALVGSYAREEANATSDIDVFITLKRPSFDCLAGVQEKLEQHFGEHVDIILDGKHLRESFRQTMQQEVLYV
jgi:predicted nucleotidyltransferase